MRCPYCGGRLYDIDGAVWDPWNNKGTYIPHCDEEIEEIDSIINGK